MGANAMQNCCVVALENTPDTRKRIAKVTLNCGHCGLSWNRCNARAVAAQYDGRLGAVSVCRLGDDVLCGAVYLGCQ